MSQRKNQQPRTGRGKSKRSDWPILFAVLAMVILAGLLLDAQYNAAIAQGYGEVAPVLAIHPE